MFFDPEKFLKHKALYDLGTFGSPALVLMMFLRTEQDVESSS